MWLAHRASWIIHRGLIGGFNVLHKCDTPSCVNPDHLFLGSQAENVMDSVRKGRHKNPVMCGDANPMSAASRKAREREARTS